MIIKEIMSSSFLSALAIAKERIESASSQLSLKLQMSLNSSPSVPCSTVSGSQSNINHNQHRSVPSKELQKTTNSNAIRKSSTVTNPIKYSDHVMVSTNSELNVSNSNIQNFVSSSDIQNFVVSKSLENSLKSSESTLSNTQSPTFNEAKFCLGPKSSTTSSNVSYSPSLATLSVTTVACGGFEIQNAESSRSYSCGSRNCNLPSCNSKYATSMKNLNFGNTIPQKIKSSEPAEKLISTTQNFVNLESLSPVSTTDSNNFPVKTETTNTVMHLPVVSEVTSVSPINNPESSKVDLFKQSNLVKYYDPRRVCVFCDRSGHSSHNCTRFRNSAEFWNIIYQKRLCKNCLRPFHFSHKCYDNSLCFFSMCRRRDKHSPILCKHKNNLIKSYPLYNRPDSCSENYQDVSFNLNSHCKKKFYSQGTQTNFVESKTVETQTVSTEDILCFLKFLDENSMILPVLQSCI